MLILNSKHSFVTAYTNASFVFNTTFLNYEKLWILAEFYDLSPAFYCPTQVFVSFVMKYMIPLWLFPSTNHQVVLLVFSFSIFYCFWFVLYLPVKHPYVGEIILETCLSITLTKNMTSDRIEWKKEYMWPTLINLFRIYCWPQKFGIKACWSCLSITLVCKRLVIGLFLVVI